MGFLGPNGAGKTTTMNILTGYLSATAGTARIDGVDVLEKKPLVAKSKIGFLPEQPPLYMDMTVKEYLNFVYGLKNCRLPRAQHIKEICEVVRIGDVYGRSSKISQGLPPARRHRAGAHRQPGRCSSSTSRPWVWTRSRLLKSATSSSCWGKEHTVILSTHILPEVQAVRDRIVVIDKGVIVANEKTEDLINAVEGSRRLIAKIVGPEDEVCWKCCARPPASNTPSCSAGATPTRSAICSSRRIRWTSASRFVLQSGPQRVAAHRAGGDGTEHRGHFHPPHRPR